MFRLEHLKESGSNSRIRFGAAWQQAMSVMYKNSKYKIQVQNWSVQCSTWQCSTTQGQSSVIRCSKSGKLFDQVEVASDGELQAFRYAVLHLEDGGGSTGRGRCNLASNRIVVVPIPSSRVEVSAETGSGGTAASHGTSEANKQHLPKSAIPKVCRLVEEGATESTVMGKGRTSSCLHVGA